MCVCLLPGGGGGGLTGSAFEGRLRLAEAKAACAEGEVALFRSHTWAFLMITYLVRRMRHGRGSTTPVDLQTKSSKAK